MYVSQTEMSNLKIFGHLLKHNSFMTNIIEGRINKHKGSRRPKIAFIKNIIKPVDFNKYVTMKTGYKQRIKFAMIRQVF